jgi:hypothetical protein
MIDGEQIRVGLDLQESTVAAALKPAVCIELATQQQESRGV